MARASMRVISTACSPKRTRQIFYCHYCPQMLASRNGMKRHETEIHQPPKECPYCYRAIRRGTNLRRHVKDQHGAELGTCVVMDESSLAVEASMIAESSATQLYPVTPPSPMNTTPFGPISPSIRLGYAPSDHSSTTIAPQTPPGNTTSNILEVSGTGHVEFGYGDSTELPVTEFGHMYLENAYNPAVLFVLNDYFSSQSVSWPQINGLEINCSPQMALPNDYDSLMPVSGEDGVYIYLTYEQAEGKDIWYMEQ